MAARVNLPPSLATDRSDAALAKRAVSSLRLELDAEHEPGRKAALSHELARHYERNGDAAAAARDALAATGHAAGFAEPIELLVRVAREHRSRSNLTKLLERLLRLSRTPDERNRAALELVGLYLEGEQIDEASALLGELVAEGRDASIFSLLRALVACHQGDTQSLHEAWHALTSSVTSSPHRARLFERLALGAFAAGSDDDGLGWLEQAYQEVPTAYRLRWLEHEARARGRLDVARSAAERLASGESLPESERLPSSEVNEARLRSALHAGRGGDPITSQNELDLLAAEQPSESIVWALAERVGATALTDPRASDVRRALLAKLPSDDADRVVLDGELALLAGWRGDAGAAAQHARVATGGYAESALRSLLMQRGLLAEGKVAAALGELASSAVDAPRPTRASLLLAEALAWAPTDPTAAARALDAAREAGLSVRITRRALRVLAWLADSPQLVLAADLTLLGGGTSDRELAWEALRLAFLLEDEAALARVFDAFPSDSVAPVLASLWLGSGAPSLDEHAARLTDPELVRALEWVRIARDLADGNAASGSARLEAILGARPTDVTARTAWVRIQERLHPEKAARALLAGARSLENEDATSTTSRLWAARAAWNLARAGKSAEAAQALERSGLPGLTPFGEAEPLLLELLGSAGRQRRKACDERAASAGSAASALLLALDALPDRQAASRVLAARQLDAGSVEQDDPASWLALLLDVSNGHDDVTWPEGLGHDERAALTVEAARVRNDDEAALTAAEAWLGSTGHAATDNTATDDPAAGTDAAWLLALLAQRGGRRDLQARSWQALGSASGSDLLTAQGLFLELGGVGAGGPSHLGDDAQHGARRAIDELAARNPGSPELGWLALEVTSPEHGVERTQAKERLAASLAAGDPADPDVATLRIHAAFERLARGENEAALELLERLESELRNDPTVLLGLAYVARALERPDVELRALTPLAERCAEDERAADHWERVGELLESRGDGVAAEQAYASALARAAERDSAFEHLYLLVRARDDKARLVELLDARLEVVREPEGRVELLWEKARSCRTLGRRASALRALELVLELDPGHLPALSLSAEMHLGDERFEKAATSLRAIATHTETPLDIVERAGLHAADLLERLHLPREAVTLLAELEQRGVAPGGILERRARNAARAEDWELSYLTFREMSETADDDSLALEGARMMLALQRDHLHDQEALLEAARWVLTLSPLDDDAIQVLLASDDSRPEDGNLLAAAFAERLGRMRAQPQLGTPMARLAELASRAGAPAVARVALGTYSLTGVLDDRQRRSLESASPAEGAPNGRLNEEELGVLAGAAAAGPLHAPARSFSPLLARLTQPSLESLGLSSLTRIDPFAEHPLRVEVAKWATLLGLSDFDLHWGGNDPTRLLWFEAELPTVVIGEGVQLPLGVRDRARLAAGCFASARGVGAIAALPNAETELWLQALLVALGTPPALGVSPDFAPDVEERAQALGQLLSRETKDALLAEFAELTQSGHSAYDVLHGVRSASARVACLVHGDPSILRGLPRLVPEDAERRRQLLSDVVTFALSEEFESLRSKMEATS